jgi:hypothetical protein
MFPSLADTDLLLLNGPYTEPEGDGSKSLSLVPPSMIGPPEFIHIDMRDTSKPGIVFRSIGKGQAAWIPWDLGALYYRLSLPAHAGLFRDVVDRLNSQRQFRTDAHPLVEMTWMRQGNRKLLHLINLSGHSETGYFPPVEMREIHVEVAGEYRSVKTVRAPADLPVPRLADYELVVLE